jgi:hypothetical protein
MKMQDDEPLVSGNRMVPEPVAPRVESPRAPPKPRAELPRISLEYLLAYCSTNPKRFKSLHAHVAAVREWLEKVK